MTNYYRLKRRLKSEWSGFKCLMGKKTTKIAIKTLYIAYEITRICYNPWYMLEYVFQNKLLTN
jgi:hypothetical protein